jgi:hypothetical protein
MRDLVYIALTIGFFALAALLVQACDRIVGPDHLADVPLDDLEGASTEASSS